MNKAPLKKRNHSQIYAIAELSINQGRRQGVCWGGGGGRNASLSTSPALKAGDGGGGGGLRHIFPTYNLGGKIIIMG